MRAFLFDREVDKVASPDCLEIVLNLVHRAVFDQIIWTKLKCRDCLVRCSDQIYMVGLLGTQGSSSRAWYPETNSGSVRGETMNRICMTEHYVAFMGHGFRPIKSYIEEF